MNKLDGRKTLIWTIIVLVFTILTFNIVHSQTPALIAVDINETKLQWTYPGDILNVDTFIINCTNSTVPSGINIAVNVPTLEVQLAGFIIQSGTYTCTVKGVNRVGESAPSESTTFFAGNKPDVPGKPIVVGE